MTDDDEQTMDLREILTNYIDGNRIGWPAHFAFLRTFHAHRIADITSSVVIEGFKEPIFLGTDGRIWDGHHRLAVADALYYGELPVIHGDESDA